MSKNRLLAIIFDWSVLRTWIQRLWPAFFMPFLHSKNELKICTNRFLAVTFDWSVVRTWGQRLWAAFLMLFLGIPHLAIFFCICPYDHWSYCLFDFSPPCVFKCAFKWPAWAQYKSDSTGNLRPLPTTVIMGIVLNVCVQTSPLCVQNFTTLVGSWNTGHNIQEDKWWHRLLY